MKYCFICFQPLVVAKFDDRNPVSKGQFAAVKYESWEAASFGAANYHPPQPRSKFADFLWNTCTPALDMLQIRDPQKLVPDDTIMFSIECDYYGFDKPAPDSVSAVCALARLCVMLSQAGWSTCDAIERQSRGRAEWFYRAFSKPYSDEHSSCDIPAIASRQFDANSENHVAMHRTSILHLPSKKINNLWQIGTPGLAASYQGDLDYRISYRLNHRRATEGVFYLNGFGGNLDDTPFLEDFVCDHMPLVRVQSMRLRNPIASILGGTFGDACALIHNACQELIALADHLRFRSYSVVGQSWGGLIAFLAGYEDPRCRKTMQLASSPDICDVVSRLNLMWNVSFLGLPWIAQRVLRKLIAEAEKAKFGESRYQDAWEAISPWTRQPQPGYKLLVFNREDDPLMRRANVEHFIAHTQTRGVPDMCAEFVPHNGRGTHDMPLAEFSSRMRRFLFDAN